MKIYVAGPYTKGDVALNVRAALEAAEALADAGHAPFVPHLTHFWHLLFPRPYEFWIAYDLEFLPFCDALLRLPGESSGADGEVMEAERLGIPVYYSVADIPVINPRPRPMVEADAALLERVYNEVQCIRGWRFMRNDDLGQLCNLLLRLHGHPEPFGRTDSLPSPQGPTRAESEAA